MKQFKITSGSNFTDRSDSFFEKHSTDEAKSLKSINSPVRVLMLGESLENCGGVVEVQKIILKHINASSENILIDHLSEASSYRNGPLLPKLLTFINALIILTYRLIFRKFDLAHIHFTERGSILRVIFLAFLCKLGRTPYILHSHGAEFEDFFLHLPKVLQNVVSYYLSAAASIVVLSESWKTYFVRDIGVDESKVDIFLNPVEIPSKIPIRTDETLLKIIFLGRIGHRKGSFDVIQAFAKAMPHFSCPVTLQMAGDGEIEKAKQLVKSFQLEDQIHLLGWISQDQRNQVLSESNIFVLPSYNEGLPLSLLEAMSWGLPVITSPVGGIPDVIEHNKNGILCTPGDVNTLSESLINLVEDKAYRTRLGAQARNCIQAFSAHDYCLQMQALYQRSVN